MDQSLDRAGAVAASRRRPAAPPTFTGNRGAADRGAADLRAGPARPLRRRPAGAAAGQGPPRRPARARRRSACRASPSRRWCATTRGCQPEELRHRHGLYPLGSCTMKHNPRLNEKMARLPGFADLHPLQPVSTVQGALELIDALAHWLKTLTGMPAVAMSPAAGAHGELCGMMAIRAALEARGERRQRKRRAGAGIGARHQPGDGGGARLHRRADPGQRPRPRRSRRAQGGARPRRRGDHADQPQHLRPVRDARSSRSPTAVHEAGAYFYCDGANFNAIVGRVRPGDLGVDCMHINLHKTFSTPHGGGGPGAGPVVLSAALAPYAPYPWIVKDGDRLARRRGRRAGRRQAARPAEGLPRPDGHVHPRARLHDEPRRRRPAAGRRGRRAQRQLRDGAR